MHVARATLQCAATKSDGKRIPCVLQSCSHANSTKSDTYQTMFPAVVNSPLQESFMAKAKADARSLVIRFGVFEVDSQAGELRKQGLKIKLREQAFQVLSLLLERPGQVVSREELQNKLWPADTFVDFDRGLNKAINHLRDALGDSAENPRFIETLPKRGYRFIAPAEESTVSFTPSTPVLTEGASLTINLDSNVTDAFAKPAEAAH